MAREVFGAAKELEVINIEADEFGVAILWTFIVVNVVSAILSFLPLSLLRCVDKLIHLLKV